MNRAQKLADWYAKAGGGIIEAAIYSDAVVVYMAVSESTQEQHKKTIVESIEFHNDFDVPKNELELRMAYGDIISGRSKDGFCGVLIIPTKDGDEIIEVISNCCLAGDDEELHCVDNRDKDAHKVDQFVQQLA